MSIIGRDAMVRNAKRRMVNEDESPIGGETLDREKLWHAKMDKRCETIGELCEEPHHRV
jgi:hypothetical protein